MCYQPIYLAKRDALVPCGHCEGCLATQRTQWIFRIKQEAKLSNEVSFLTLTYNDDNLMITENGEMSLYKKDLKDYFKRVRKREKRLRYFACGEYGTKNGRPHYHGIVFNTSDQILIDAWTVNGEEKGFVDVEPVNEGAIQYVTKYIVNDERGYQEVQRPFRLMSKGLGKNMLNLEVQKFYSMRKEGTMISEGGVKITMPRYFKEKIFSREEMSEIGVVNSERAEERLSNMSIEQIRNERKYLRAKNYKSSKSLKI